MFDVGFSEILVIAVVALLVLGPERLPKAARFAGLWVRRARAQWNSVKAELENELADEELRRSISAARSELHDTLHSTRKLIEPGLVESGAIKPATLESAAPESATLESAAQPTTPTPPIDEPAQPMMTATPRKQASADSPRAAHSDAPTTDG